MAQLRAEDKKIEDVIFLSSDKFKIPRYQRPYSWDEDQVSDFWNDLYNNSSNLFFGSFVFNYEYYEAEEYIEVIDGQQRLITITILLCVLRDFYKKLKDNRKANLTQRHTVAFEDHMTGKETYRLECGESLVEFFQDNLQKEGSDILATNPRKKEHKLVKNNYLFFKNQIEEELKKEDNLEKKIIILDDIKKKLANLKIIWIRIETDDDAYSIFETVNARGVDLTVADLLKNHLLSQLREKDGIDIAKNDWLEIESNVEEVGGLLSISKFIRYYWLSQYGSITEKELYKEIKNQNPNPSEFLDKLKLVSNYYSIFSANKNDQNAWVELGFGRRDAGKISDICYALRIMKITQFFPLLICLLVNREKTGLDFISYLEKIEKHHFVYSAICKQPGNKVEKLYSGAAKNISDIFKSKVKNIDGSIQKILDNLINDLKKIRPNKETFVDRFMEIEYKNKDLVYYIFSKMEKYRNPSLETKINYDEVSIEHILPQNPEPWGLNKNDIKGFVNRLGNLSLLGRRPNGGAQNSTLKDKLKLYKESAYKITNTDLVSFVEDKKNKWNEEIIKERQKEIANEAFDLIWSL